MENTAEKMSHEDATANPSVEGENKESLSSTRGARFREEFLRRIVPWEKIPNVSLDAFPYYIPECTKTLLMECVASHLKEKKFRSYGGRLASSSNRILLQSIQGTRIYRERLVCALAGQFQVPLLKLDSSGFPPYDDFTSEGKSDEECLESAEELDDDENDTTDHEKEDEGSIDDSNTKTSADKVCLLKKGDRVKYVGPNTSIKEANNRILSKDQRGEVSEVNGNKVAVVFHINGLATKKAEKDEKIAETAAKALVTWLDVKHVERDHDVRTHDCYIAMEVLYEVLESQRQIVVYFPDSFLWLSQTASSGTLDKFVSKVQKMFEQLSGRLVLICGQDKKETGSKPMEMFPFFLNPPIKGFKGPGRYAEHQLSKIFTNVVYIKPPEDQDLRNTFDKQIEEDKTTMILEGNLKEIDKVLKEHNLICMDLEQANIDDMTLTTEDAVKVVGWATNHYLSSCPLPHVKEDQLHVPHESLKLAILRLKEQEPESNKKASKSVKELASDEYERRFVSAVVRPDDINVKFDDVGALEDVKKALHELVILPMRRPELFSHGNLLRPCKGMLLFGPPGTGKTLIAKALATEAGANFISITPASLGSKWYGESENLTRALFSYASKLAPVIIFVDEVDALLGARGGRCEHEATRRMRNEFMAAWDGLTSKESQRILVIGASNRPFDLDDAVIRRMPRRILVDLPDVVNRSKILKILLAKENLESGFSFEQLAEATEGYSGSDLKNLCVAAAYRPVQEIIEKESKGEISDGAPAILRPLNVDDFIHSKAKVGASVAYNSSSIMELRKWNQQYGQGGSR